MICLEIYQHAFLDPPFEIGMMEKDVSEEFFRLRMLDIIGERVVPVLELKDVRTSYLLISNLCQSFYLSVLNFYNHFAKVASFFAVRLDKPRPPLSFGEQSVSQQIVCNFLCVWCSSLISPQKNVFELILGFV